MRVERCYGSRICEFIRWCLGMHWDSSGGGGRVRYGAGRQWSRFLLLLLLVCDVLKFMLMFILVVFVVMFSVFMVFIAEGAHGVLWCR